MSVPTPAEVMANADFLARIKRSLDSLSQRAGYTDQDVDKILAIFIERDYGTLQGTKEANAAWAMIFARLQDNFRSYYSTGKQAVISPTKNDWAAQSDDFNAVTALATALRDEASGVIASNFAIVTWLAHNAVPIALGIGALVMLIKYRNPIKTFFK